jgi:hypothetical protein
MQRWKALVGKKEKRDFGWKKSSDRAVAFEHCMALSDGDEISAELLLQWVMRRAGLLIEAQWPQIEKLACALLEKQKFTGNGEMTGDEVTELLSRA